MNWMIYQIAIKFCPEWSHLIAERTKKVKYLVEYQNFYGLEPPIYTVDYVYYHPEKPINGTCLSTLFPNLIIAVFSCRFREKVRRKDIVRLFKKTKLKGLLHFSYLYDDFKSIYQYINELEMVATHRIHRYIRKNSASIKQLQLWKHNLYSFKHYAHYFPNIESLHLHSNNDYPNGYYDGPILSKLKIVILGFCFNAEDINYSFQFTDSCPNLQSAFIHFNNNRIFVDESLNHQSLQDLVIDSRDANHCDSVEWNELKRLFMKYPNLKHLSLRGNRSLENEHIEQLVRMLPKLVLFEVRECPRVTQNAANFVQDYCERQRRSIKFYFDENYDAIRSDWPQLSVKYELFSRGFDFMKHCFLKHFLYLPTFLVPDED